MPMYTTGKWSVPRVDESHPAAMGKDTEQEPTPLAPKPAPVQDKPTVFHDQAQLRCLRLCALPWKKQRQSSDLSAMSFFDPSNSGLLRELRLIYGKHWVKQIFTKLHF